jgi:hypothetical protein
MAYSPQTGDRFAGTQNPAASFRPFDIRASARYARIVYSDEVETCVK